jgi:hypothetical protein
MSTRDPGAAQKQRRLTLQNTEICHEHQPRSAVSDAAAMMMPVAR